MKHMFIGAALACALALGTSGCATQEQNEKVYTLAAGVADAGILSGKETPSVVGDTCVVDDVDYMALESGRSSADTFSYVPSDNAHVKLQTDGSPLDPLSCRPPS